MTATVRAPEAGAATSLAWLRTTVRLAVSPRVLAGSALVVGVAIPFLGIGPFWLYTAGFIVVDAIGALGLNVLTGYTGQVSLGHAFFLGVGAYTAAVLGLDHGFSVVVWLPAAGIVAALFGLAVGPAALRLRGLYLAIVTIGLVFVGGHYFSTLTSVSGGSQGRAMPAPAFLGLDFGTDTSTLLGVGFDRNSLNYYLALVILIVAMVFVSNLSRTRVGRALRAVRDRESAAALMGVDVARTKVTAFVLSAFLAGVCGALYGSYLTHVDPNGWNLLLSIQFVAMIIVGGIGTVWGALLGAIFVQGIAAVLTDYADSIPFLQNSAGGGVISVGDASDIAYGVLIVGFLVIAPGGLIGLLARLRARILRWCAPAQSPIPARLEETA